jgi:hypothetical protein
MMALPAPTSQPRWESAAVAAEWWAEQLTRPTFDADAKSNGPALDAQFTAEMAASHQISDSQRDCFRNALTALIDERLESDGAAPLFCDYSPAGMLLEAATEVGVPKACFPWKKSLDVYRQYIMVSDAYRSRLLWSVPDWRRPPCGRQRYVGTDDERQPTNEQCGRLWLHDGACGDWKPDLRRCVCGGRYTDHFSGSLDTPDLCQQWYRSMVGQ